MAIYVFSVILSRKSFRNEPDKKMPYACGERLASLTSIVVITLYKYVIYFIILDSSLAILAFASMALNHSNIWFFSIYVLMLLISSLLLPRGEE